MRRLLRGVPATEAHRFGQGPLIEPGDEELLSGELFFHAFSTNWLRCHSLSLR